MKRILVVDDAATVRMYHRGILESSGYKVEEAWNGIEALEKALESSFDLYVVDVNMPKLDGLGFTKKLRAIERFRDLPIVILTTETERRKKIEAVGAGATAWLAKPVEAESLLATMRKLDPSRAIT